MAEEFQDIKFELQKRTNDTTWVDITPDVLHEPRPRGSRGIMNNGYLDKTADPGELTFSLNNSATNANATLGYWSDTTPRQIEVGDKIRLSFVYNGRRRYKWAGYVASNGISVTPGVLGQRRVDVTCHDWFGLLSYYPLDFLTYTTNKRIEEAVALVIASLPAGIQPAFTNYDTGLLTFPDMFDTMKGETTAIGEMNKLAISEMGYIYTIDNEVDGLTLVVENRTHKYNIGLAGATQIPQADSQITSYFLLANGVDKLLLADGSSKLLLSETFSPSFNDADVIVEELRQNTGDDFANYFKVNVTPRRVDTAATTVLWNMESSIMVPAGGTISDLRARYRDPSAGAQYVNGINMVTPVATTDYQAFQNDDGTGTNLTANLTVTVQFGTAEADITLVNTGGTDLYTGGDILFQLRGMGVYIYDKTEIIVDNTQYATVGRYPLIFDMMYTSDVISAKNFLDDLFQGADDDAPAVTGYPLLANRNTKNMMAFMFLQPGAYINTSESLAYNGLSSYINGYSFEIINMKYVKWSLCLLEATKIITS